MEWVNMNIVTMGSYLSQMVAERCVKLFDMNLLNTIAHNRSDQFYHFKAAYKRCRGPLSIGSRGSGRSGKMFTALKAGQYH